MKLIGAARLYSYRPGCAGDIAHVQAKSGGVVDNVVSYLPARPWRRRVPSERNTAGRNASDMEIARRARRSGSPLPSPRAGKESAVLAKPRTSNAPGRS